MKTYEAVDVKLHPFLTSAVDGGDWSAPPPHLHPAVAPLLRRKSPLYALDRRLDGPQSRSWRGEEKRSLPLPGIEPR
jgi:hypothetical protein